MKGLILWGFHMSHNAGEVMNLGPYSKSLTRERLSEGWTVALYRKGRDPEALREQAEEAKTKTPPCWRCIDCPAYERALTHNPHPGVLRDLIATAQDHVRRTGHTVERDGLG